MVKLIFVLSAALLSNLIGFSQTNEMVDLRDNKHYKTIQIGQQTWMAENLAYQFALVYPKNADLLGAKFEWIDSIRNPINPNYFYTLEAAKNVCPENWHLPNEQEFKIMLKYLEVSGYNHYRDLLEHGKSGLEIKFT